MHDPIAEFVMGIPRDFRKATNWTASALFGVAVLQGILGWVGWAMNGRGFGWLDWAFACSGVIYLGLAIAARWLRFPAALIAASLYAGFLALQWSHGVAALKSGLLFKMPTVGLLLVAIMCGLRRCGDASSRS